MEHLQTDLYHSPPLEFAQDSCSSDVCQHKALQSPQFTASEQQNYCESTVLPERLKWKYKLRRKTQIKQANGKEKIWKDDRKKKLSEDFLNPLEIQVRFKATGRTVL